MAEKKLSEVSAAWRELFDKGMEALNRQNLDYALTIFCQILEKEPGFYDCREALRAAQFKKTSGGTSFFRRAFSKATSTGPLLAKAQLALRSNPLEAILIAEHILNSDPQSVMAHKLLADAALASDLPKTAVLSLEIARKQSPRDRHLSIRLAKALTVTGNIDKAEKIYSEMLEADPHDHEIAQALKDMSARRTMREGGYDALADGSGSYRDVLKDEKMAVQLEQEHREVKTVEVANNLIADFESRLKTEPNNLRIMRSLAELHAQKKDFERALSYYDQIAVASVGTDPALEKTVADLRLKKIDYDLAQLDQNAPDYAEKAAQINARRRTFQIEECQRRLEKFPTDLHIRFEMGQIYFEAGQINEAIQEFQKAQANPNKRIQSLHYLGQCFSRRNMFDLASRSLQNALKEKVGFDEERKELIYSLGCVLEKMKKNEEAIEQFKLIYEVDIGYKDVSAKVDAYYSSQHQ